jgi:hypothetical protein
MRASRKASFIYRTAMDFLNEEQEGKDVLNACCMSEQEVHLTILRAFTAYILSFEHLSYPPYYWERVFFYAPTVENLAESHPQYFELLDGLVLWCVCCGPPSVTWRRKTSRFLQ